MLIAFLVLIGLVAIGLVMEYNYNPASWWMPFTYHALLYACVLSFFYLLYEVYLAVT